MSFNDRRKHYSSRKSVVDGRDQRIFSSSIRSALGGQQPRNNGYRNNRAPRERQSAYQSIDEALKELGHALEQPSTSLDDLELFIRQNAAKMEKQECQEVASKLVDYALKSGEFRFLLKICVDCIKHLDLMDAVAQEILLAANDYFLAANRDNQVVPELFGHIISARWPPGKGKAIESVNPILFVGLNVVLSWINIMKSYGQFKSSSTTTKDSERDKDELDNEEAKSDASTSNEEPVFKEESDKEEYDENTAALASVSIFTVANIAQRNFWLNFMEAFDDVFVATKQLLTNPNARLPRYVKELLLQLYLSLFKWSATNQPKFTTTTTQT